MGYHGTSQQPATESNENTPSKQEIVTRIAAAKSFDTLRDWDRNYLDSISEQLERRGSLSPKQIEILVKIEYRNSPEAMQQAKAWKGLYDDEKRSIAKICASYYAATGYFADLSDKILNTEDFVPTEKQYRAMCENKYAKKVIKAALGEAKFTVGDSVMLRTSAPWDAKTKMGDNGRNGGVIIADNAKPVVSAANGSKQYQILPFGSFTSVFVEERYIKKFRMPKKVS